MDDVRRQIDDLLAEVNRLRALVEPAPDGGAAGGEPDTPPMRSSRRNLLRLAAVTATGAGAATVLGARPAAAAGTPLYVGTSNSASAPTSLGAYPLSTGQSVLALSASSTTTYAVTGAASGADSAGIRGEATNDSAVGVYGHTASGYNAAPGVLGTSSAGGVGIHGDSYNSSARPAFTVANTSAGVLGTGLVGVVGTGSAVGVAGGVTDDTDTSSCGVSGEGYTGVAATTNSPGGYALSARSVQGVAAVHAFADTGKGLDITSYDDWAIDVFAQNDSGLRLRGGGYTVLHQLGPTVGHPTGTARAYTVGDQVKDSAGDLWLCVADGSPGTWNRVTVLRDGYVGGVLHALAKPIHLLDTRAGASAGVRPGKPIAKNHAISVQVTGTKVAGVSVPAGANAIACTVTGFARTAVPAAYLVGYPADLTRPTVQTMAIPTVDATSCGATLTLSADGAINLYSSGVVADAVIDVVGFYV